MSNGLTVGVQELGFLRDQAVQAAGAKNRVHLIDGFDDEISGIFVDQAGEVREHIKRAPPRRVKLFSLSDFSLALNQATEASGAKPAVYVSRYGVDIIWNDSTGPDGRGRDRTEYIFEPSDENQAISDGILNISQKNFVQILRRDLKFALGELATTLIPAVSSIKWSVGSRGSMVVSNGRESMGREIDQEIVSSSGSLPDEIVLNLLLCSDLATPYRYPVRCILEVDATQQNFTLSPMAGEFDKAWGLFVNQVLQDLREQSKGICEVLWAGRVFSHS